MTYKFVVSDPSTNSYGFFIPNEEIDWTNFHKNPICLYMHNMYKPIGTWSEPILEDGKWIAELTIDESDDEGKSLASKVKNKVIRATSLGASIQDFEKMSDSLYKAKGVIPQEISLVTIASNSNAIRLYSQTGDLIPEMDVKLHIKSSDETQIEQSTKTKTSMDIKQVALSLGLSETADSSAITAKIIELKADSSFKKKFEDLNAKITLEKKQEFLSKVQLKVSAKALDATMKDDYVTLYDQNPTLAETMLDKLVEPKDLKSVPQPSGQATTTVSLSTEYDKAEQDGTLQQILNTQPEQFKLMYKAKYGIEPEL